MQSLRSLALGTLSALMLLQTLSTAGTREYLVTDFRVNRVLRYDFETGNFLGELIGPSNPLSGDVLDGPVAMTISPTGTLLVASRGSEAASGKVSEFDRVTGEYLGDLVTGLEQPNDLLFHQGNLFVSSLGPAGFDGDTVYRFDSAGNLVTELVTGANEFGRSGLAVGPDGKLYVGSFFDGRVIRFDLSTNTPDGFDSAGTFGSLSPAGFTTGYITFDGDNNLLATDLFATFSVVKLDGTTGANLGYFIPPGALFFPSDVLALTATNELLVTSLGNDDPNLPFPLGPGFVSKFDLTTGALIDAAFIAGDGGLLNPSSILLVNDLLGDLNLDGFVGQDDLNIILDVWGESVVSGSAADVSRDGFVGQDDLNYVLADWGKGELPTVTSARLAVVPESQNLLWGTSAFVFLVAAFLRRRARLMRTRSV